MAEGGGRTYENPGYDPDRDDDDDDDDGRCADDTTPFLPTGSSAPANGQEIEIQPVRHEKTGQPETSYVEETSFGAPSLSENAWVAATKLFPNMSSSELEVSYSAKGRLQVKMFGAGKKLYNVMTTEKGTGIEVITKSLPKEIKTALGSSKFEKVQQITYEKGKELKEKQYEASKEKNKKEMDEIRESLSKAHRDLETLENSNGTQREIDKVKAKIRTLEAEHVKARHKYFKSFQAEKDKSNLEQDIGVLEDIKEQDLLQEENDASEALKVIRKRKEALDWRKK